MWFCWRDEAVKLKQRRFESRIEMNKSASHDWNEWTVCLFVMFLKLLNWIALTKYCETSLLNSVCWTQNERLNETICVVVPDTLVELHQPPARYPLIHWIPVVSQSLYDSSRVTELLFERAAWLGWPVSVNTFSDSSSAEQRFSVGLGPSQKFDTSPALVIYRKSGAVNYSSGLDEGQDSPDVTNCRLHPNVMTQLRECFPVLVLGNESIRGHRWHSGMVWWAHGWLFTEKVRLLQCKQN